MLISTVSRRALRTAVIAVSLALVSLALGGAPARVAAADDGTTHAIDAAAPHGANGWFTGPVKVSLNHGAPQTLKAIQYRVDGGPWQAYLGEEVIFDGTDASFARWKQAPSGSFRLLPDGTLLTNGGLGMLWYPVEYGDVSLKFEWRDAKPGPLGSSNGGVFLRFPNPDQAAAAPAEQKYPCQVGSGQSSPAWVAIYCGHEFQIYDGTSGEPQKTGSVYNFQPLDLAQAKPGTAGDWNTYEVKVEGAGDYTATISRNGEAINTFVNAPGKTSSRDGDPGTDLRQFARGYIGLQNHGSSDYLQIRNVTVTKLTPDPIVVSAPGRHNLEYRAVAADGTAEATRSLPINIDSQAPVTTASATQPAGGEVTVSLGSGDGTDGSGVVSTEYSLDGGAWQPYEAPQVPLFDGSQASFEGWSQAGPGGWFVTEEQTLRSTGGMGMLWYSAAEFGDVAIKLQFREARTDGGFSNSGVFVRFPRPEGRPACEPLGRPEWIAVGCGHEIQIYDGPTGEVQKTGSVYNFKPLNLDQAKPTAPGEWNDYEIRTAGAGAYTVTILRNGEVINTFTNTPGQFSSRRQDPPTDLRQNASGYIGLQNHSTTDQVEFRNIRVQDLNPAARAFKVTGAGTHTVQYRSIDAAGNVEEVRTLTFTIPG